MATIKIQRQLKIGSLTKIYTEEYEVPKRLYCKYDGYPMEFNSHFQAYACTCGDCRNWITAKEYIEEETAKYDENGNPIQNESQDIYENGEIKTTKSEL